MSATQGSIDSILKMAGIEGIDRAAVRRFVNDTINRRPVDQTDAAHAGVLLFGLLQGVRAGDDIGVEFRRLMRARKARVKMFDPDTAPMGSPAWAIVERYVRGEISHAEAVDRFQKEVHPAHKRHREAWIAAMKPRVQSTVDYINTIIAKTE